jgi:uncharacterized membrane protein (UPF0136 family)
MAGEMNFAPTNIAHTFENEAFEGGAPLFYGKNVKVRLLSGLALGSRLTAAA